MSADGRPADPYAAAYQSKPPDAAPARKGGRGRPIRLRITALLLVPLVSLITLWAFAANITLGDAFDRYDFSTTYEKVGVPGLQLVNQLQAERSLSVVVLSTGAAEAEQQLSAHRERVGAVEREFRQSALSPEARDAAQPETKQRLTAALKALDTVPRLRERVDTGDAQALELINAYGAVLDEVIKVFSDLVSVNDVGILTQGRALISIGNAHATMLRQDSLVIAAMARNGRFTPAEHTAFVQWAAEGRRQFAAGLADLNEEIRGPLQRLADSDEYQAYRAAETAIVQVRDDRLPPEVAQWQATTRPLSQAWGKEVTQASTALNEMAEPIGRQIITRLVLAGGFGLLAVIASIVLSLLAARSLSRELRGLQRAALNLAENRLPSVVARLRRGEEVDVDAEAPPLVIGKTREVARVGDAFTKVQHTAIDTAVREAYLRQGISRVFLNVAWRSQSLLHRQLRMLDEMERAASDPKALEDLFRLDHLTTRMRRHAEGLVILSGTAPGRGWSRPVHVEDVLRAAISEVEDYTRVEVVVVSGQAAVIGEAVADIIHLLAELIENATVFSPAPTEVLVRGEMGANGFAVDIIDRGIGLDQAELDALNLRLSRPPEFDLAVTDRLGLFVVSRLAGRHGIRVALQPSLYGGVSAVVLIPRILIVDVDQPEDEDGFGAADPRPAHPQANGAASGNGAVRGPVSDSSQAWPTPSAPSSTAMLNAPTPFDTGHDTGPVQGAPLPPDTGPVSTGPISTGPSTTGSSTTGPSTTGSSTTGPSTTGPPDTPAPFEDRPGPDATVGFNEPAPFQEPSYDGNETPPSYGTPPSSAYGTAPQAGQYPEGQYQAGQYQGGQAALDATGPRQYPRQYPQGGAGHGAPSSFGEAPSTQTPHNTQQARTGPDGRAPLPRRVRGGSMVHQLRDEQPLGAQPAAQDDAIAAWEDRSAEASRDLFASLQAGWLRGRDEDEAPGDAMEGRS